MSFYFEKSFANSYPVILWLMLLTDFRIKSFILIMTLWYGSISALLALCDGNTPVHSGFYKGLITWSFDIFSDLQLNARLNMACNCTHWPVCDVTVLEQPLSTWTSCHICKIAGCACAGNAGDVFPASAGKRSRHYGTCVTHVPRCMPGSLTSGFLWSQCGENVIGIPVHAQPTILRIL